MNTTKLLRLLLLIFGEVLIVTSFLYFGKYQPVEVLPLNIIVTSIIYSLYFIDILFPIVDFKNKSNKTIGSIGARWFFTWSYMILAVIIMIVCNAADINTQIIIHGILFFLLAIGLYFSVTTSEQVEIIFSQQIQNKNLVDEMKKATKEVRLKLEGYKTIPSDIILKLSSLQKNLRFISPCNDDEAKDLEMNYLKEINEMKDYMFKIPDNYDEIAEKLEKCERIYKERKKFYSN